MHYFFSSEEKQRGIYPRKLSQRGWETPGSMSKRKHQRSAKIRKSTLMGAFVLVSSIMKAKGKEMGSWLGGSYTVCYLSLII